MLPKESALMKPQARFIIPDPDLKDQKGHNCNYDLAICNELSSRSIHSILISDKSYRNSTESEFLTVMPAFSSISSQIRRKIQALLRRRPSENESKESSDRNTKKTAKSSTTKTQNLFAFLTSTTSSIAQPLNNFGHLKNLYKQVTPQLRSGDVVLISVYAPLVVLTRAIWLNSLQRRGIQVKTIVVVHAQVTPRRVFDLEVKLLKRLTSSQNIIFSAHTQPLADYFSQRCGEHFLTLPYPFSPPTIPAEQSTNTQESDTLTIVYLGSASIRRGFDLLIEAIDSIRDLLDNGTLTLRIQAYSWISSEGSSGTDLFQQLRDYAEKIPAIVPIQKSLPSQQYYQEIHAADLLLIPHRPEHFPMARSGVFSEALSLGKPVIVSTGTYMAEELKHHGSGLLFENGNSDSLASTIRQAIDNIDSLRARAITGKTRWTKNHNPGRFIDEILRAIEPS